jgi:cobalt-precorrin-7 (C5)-methyltransferase
MNKIYVLGVGPGHPDLILPLIEKKAWECQVLVGGKRNLALFKELGKDEIVIGADVEGVIDEIKEIRRTQKVAVLVTGDPGLYSFMTTLLRHFSRDELEVYPGISSLQYLFARGALPWQDALIMSLHGRRPAELLELIRSSSKAGLLTDNKFPAGEVARSLIAGGVRGKRALVGENLSYPEERIRDLPLEEWVGQEVADLCVMVIYDE